MYLRRVCFVSIRAVCCGFALNIFDFHTFAIGTYGMLCIVRTKDTHTKKPPEGGFLHHINSLAAVFVAVTHMREQDHVADAWRVGQ